MRLKLDWDEPDMEPDPICERCEAGKSMCRCLPLILCPVCGEEHEDVTGFGVLACDWCGFTVEDETHAA